MQVFESAEAEMQKNTEKSKKKPNPFEAKGLAGGIYFILHDAVSILAVVIVLFVFVARLVGVSGYSMYPTLVGAKENAGTTGDYLILLSNFLSDTYEQGDIVVACVPTFDRGKPIVKRVIAVGGQEVSIRYEEDNYLHVFVDGVLQPEDFINEPMVVPAGGYSATVPEGCYFLMGDNRNDSHDSRWPDIGMVDGRYIVGKALVVAIPGQDVKEWNSRTWSRIGDIYD